MRLRNITGARDVIAASEYVIQEPEKQEQEDQEQEAPDFAKIAEELQQRHEQEKRSLNDRYIKDTIYIEENIYKAFNALCTERGMKKQLVNEALADFVQKKYRELQKKNL